MPFFESSLATAVRHLKFMWEVGGGSGGGCQLQKPCFLRLVLFKAQATDYLFLKTLYLATAIWAIFDHTYSGFLAARILMGFASGAAETIAPVTISDLFFLHERGSIMALYTSFLSVGVGFGMIIAG